MPERVLACLLAILPVMAAAPAHGQSAETLSDIDALIERANAQEAVEQDRRLEEHQAALAQVQQNLADAQARLDALRAEADRKTEQFEVNQAEINTLHESLMAQQSEFIPLYQAFRNHVEETAADLAASPTTAHRPGRASQLVQVAQSRQLPSTTALQAAPRAMLEEMILQRQVVRFDAMVDGASTAGPVPAVRVGGLSVLFRDGDGVHFARIADGATEELARLCALARPVPDHVRDAAAGALTPGTQAIVSTPILDRAEAPIGEDERCAG